MASQPVFPLLSVEHRLQPELPLQEPPTVAAVQHSHEPLPAAVSAMTASVIEAICGRRPLHQLQDLAHPSVLAAIARLAVHHRGSQVRVRSLRVQSPSADAMEVSVHLVQDGRSKAAALRLTRELGQWRISDLQIALDRPRLKPRRAA